VERELQRLFPGVGVLRMDLDTTTRKGAHRSILGAFRRGKAQVLLGTQMVAKGLHFPRVTLVGVISADVGLHLPDFRAEERTFQLLTQVAGRAGRGELGGEVVIQTYSPEAYPIQCAREYDFSKFFEEEARKRRELHYPPFGRLLNLLLRGRDQARVEGAAGELAQALRENLTGDGFLQVLGPAPAPLSRLKGEYRWQILLKGEKAGQLQDLVRNCLKGFKGLKGVKLSLDVDPVEVL